MPDESRKRYVIVGVDDDPANLRLLEAALVGAGFTFLGCDSGSECLSLLRRVQPRVVLMDIMMPKMDGVEAVRRIRRDYPTLKVPVVYVTALRQMDHIKEGLAAGGNDYLIKPFDIEKLISRVEHWARLGMTA